MALKKHWSPRYLAALASYRMYSRANPGSPWLTQTAVSILDTMLKPGDRMLEFGSGRSTAWLAARVGHITSVEHNPSWHATVLEMFRKQGLANVDYRLAEISGPDGPKPGEPYVAVASEFADESLDVVLVDGMYRGACVLAVIPKLKPGGILVIDNVQWFLPSRTRSPKARGPQDGPKDATWAAALSVIGGWRNFWTTNELSDTAFYFKPCN